MLSADVVVYADGGGKGPALPRPVHGRERAARVFLGGATAGRRLGVIDLRTVTINGQPGAVFIDRDGRPVGVVTVDVADGLIQTVRAITNPEKLSHLDRFPNPR
jgi:hypothetical protein